MPGRVFLVLRLAIAPVLLTLIALMETQHFVSWFRLVSFIAVAFLAADIASLLRGKLRDLMIVVASIAFGLSLIEAGANVLEPRQLFFATNGWSVPRPIIGWGPEHAGRFHAEKDDPATGAPIYSVEYTIDSNLLRETRSCQSGSTIAFFGCSFMFGDGVNDAETLPQDFADLLDRKQRVLNLAFSGYGPQQFLLELQTGVFDGVIGPQPKLFVFMTAAWHVERTACKPFWGRFSPHYMLENDQIVFKGPCSEGMSLALREWLEATAMYRVVIAPFRHKISHDDVELYLRILLAAVNLAKEKYGVPTLIAYLKGTYSQAPEGALRGTGFDDDAIIKRLRDGGAIVIDASLLKEQADGAKISLPHDGHPTALANRLRASMIKDYIDQHLRGVLVAGSERDRRPLATDMR